MNPKSYILLQIIIIIIIIIITNFDKSLQKSYTNLYILFSMDVIYDIAGSLTFLKLNTIM